MITKSSKLVLERAGILETYRNPTGTISKILAELKDFGLRGSKLEPPLQMISQVRNGEPPPDRGMTPEPWPDGEKCDV